LKAAAAMSDNLPQLSKSITEDLHTESMWEQYSKVLERPENEAYINFLN
jgi:hypothetical protein